MKTKSPKKTSILPAKTASKPLLHPPLSEVVFEINFPRSFVVENHIADYQRQLSAMYPDSGDEFVLYVPPAVSFGKPPKSEGGGMTPVRSFVFHNSTGARVIRISVVHFSLLVSDYVDYEDYKSALMAALKPAIDIFGLQRLDRVGLRYINKIPIPKEQPLTYENYVRSPIDPNGFLPHTVSKFLTEVSVDVDKKRTLTIRSGLLPPQPDSSTRIYLLDLDCSSPESISLPSQDLRSLLDDFHEAIESEFKRAIVEEYWKYIAEGVPM